MGEASNERPGERRRGTVPVVVLLAVGALGAIVFAIGVSVLRGVFSGDGPPSCDAEPVVLGWTEGERGWMRTRAFVLEEAQTVQVDVRVFDSDGGVLQFGSTVYLAPAGEPFPDFSETATTTEPFAGVRVGHGREAVNEQVDLDAGDWQLMVQGDAAPAEVRWPC